MIHLEKKDENWEDWLVHLDNEKFLLKEYGGKWDEGIYDFPSSSDHNVFIDTVVDCKFDDFPKELYIVINNKDDFLGKYVSHIYVCSHEIQKYLGYLWEIEVNKWEGHINPYFIRNEMAKILKEQTEFPLKKGITTDDDSGYTSIYFDLDITKIGCLKAFYSNFSTFLNGALENIEERLSIGGFANKVVAKFSFDEVSKQACISYLYYFIDFLKDLGLDSKGDIINSGTEVLFSIIPSSKETSLINISQALSIYLKLPNQDMPNSQPEYLDPIVELKLERLKNEIERLKGNLKTSEILLRYQDNLLKISKLKKPIDALTSIHINNEEREKTEFLGGGVKLGVLKKAGVEFDWSALLRFFKRQ